MVFAFAQARNVPSSPTPAAGLREDAGGFAAPAVCDVAFAGVVARAAGFAVFLADDAADAADGEDFAGAAGTVFVFGDTTGCDDAEAGRLDDDAVFMEDFAAVCFADDAFAARDGAAGSPLFVPPIGTVYNDDQSSASTKAGAADGFPGIQRERGSGMVALFAEKRYTLSL